MSETRSIVATAAVGSPETLSEKHTIVASFYGFKGLPHARGDRMRSPEMTCHGHRWTIDLRPGGDKTMTAEDKTWTSIYLRLISSEDVEAKFTIRVGSKSYCSSHHFKASNSSSWGWRKFLLRSDVLDPTQGYLNDNTLEVEVDIIFMSVVHKHSGNQKQTGCTNTCWNRYSQKMKVIYASLLLTGSLWCLRPWLLAVSLRSVT